LLILSRCLHLPVAVTDGSVTKISAKLGCGCDLMLGHAFLADQLLLQQRRPVQDKSRADGATDGNSKQETLTVGRDAVILVSRVPPEPCPKQRTWGVCPESGCGTNVHRHQRAQRVHIEQLPPIGSPLRLDAAGGRDLPAFARCRERDDEDLEA